MITAAPHGGDIYAFPDLIARIRSGSFIDFSVNTNPLGMPPPVLEALRNEAGDFARYPDPHCRKLRSALASYEGVGEDLIVCGNGAADILFRLCHYRKPREVLVPVPAFSEYERAAREAGARTRYHFLREDEEFALTPRVLDDIGPDLDMVFLANPNNPTGKLVPEDLIREILRRCAAKGILLVIDECFLPFTDAPSAVALHEEAPESLIVIKALTKTFSLAGTRLGYCVCGKSENASALKESGQYWGVSGPAQTAGFAALSCGAWFAESKKMIRNALPKLAEDLRGLGLKVFGSDANFLLFRTENPAGPPLERSCFERGILIRPCGNFAGLDSRYYRAAVRRPEENRALVNALRSALLLHT